jgi:uncharacterized protein
MPPPPMPAKLDPTTVSSIPRADSPRVFTSKLSSPSSLSCAQPSDLPALPSPSTPFANLSLLSPTASHSSDSSPLSPKLSTLTSFFLTTSTTSPDVDTRGPTQMDLDKDSDPCDSGPPPWVRSPSPQPLCSSEPLTRVPCLSKSQVESLSPASSPYLSLDAPEQLVASDPPPAQSPPLAASTPSLPKIPKVKMSLKDFAMRKKKQREEEQARAAALPLSPTPRNGGPVDVVPPDSDPPLYAATNLGITDGADGASEGMAPDSATPRVTIESVTGIDSGAEPSFYSLPQINGVHLDTALASTLAEIAQAIPPGKGCRFQDDVGAIEDSTPGTHGVKCNGDRGRHLNSVSPRSSRTPSPSLTESEDSETGNGMTTRSILLPPTQPRSFTVNASASSPVLSSSGSGGPLPHRLPPSSTYRPGSSYVPPSIPPSVRPLPSGPRALRAGMGGQQQQQSGARGYGHHHPHGHPHGPGSFAGVPRGPSSSVERERDRGWMGLVRGRGRGAASSWGR